FRFIDASNVLERHLRISLDIDLGARLTHRHEPAKSLLIGEAAKQEHPDQIEDDDRNDPRQNGLDHAAWRSAIHHDLMGGEFVENLRIDADGIELSLAIRQRRLQRALNGIRSDDYIGNLVLVE